MTDARILDANVLFSASHIGSSTARLMERVAGRDQAVTSDLAVDKARRNIERKRPTWITGFHGLLHGIEEVPSVLFELPVALAEKDPPILCTAIRSRCDYLATGDLGISGICSTAVSRVWE